MYKSGRCFFNKLPNIIVGMGTALVSWVVGGHAHAARFIYVACNSWQDASSEQIAAAQEEGRNQGCSGGWGLFYYTDRYGNRAFYDHCEYGCKSGYKEVVNSVSVSGCTNLQVTYRQCLPTTTAPTNKWCDNDYYYENGSCIHCPVAVVNFFDENGLPLDGASGQCGYGSENGTNTPISSCKIYASGCEYCDDSGCFELRNDCWYNFS